MPNDLEKKLASLLNENGWHSRTNFSDRNLAYFLVQVLNGLADMTIGMDAPATPATAGEKWVIVSTPRGGSVNGLQAYAEFSPALADVQNVSWNIFPSRATQFDTAEEAKAKCRECLAPAGHYLSVHQINARGHMVYNCVFPTSTSAREAQDTVRARDAIGMPADEPPKWDAPWQRLDGMKLICGHAYDVWAIRWDCDRNAFTGKRFTGATFKELGSIDRELNLPYGAAARWTGVDNGYHVVRMMEIPRGPATVQDGGE